MCLVKFLKAIHIPQLRSAEVRRDFVVTPILYLYMSYSDYINVLNTIGRHSKAVATSKTPVWARGERSPHSETLKVNLLMDESFMRWTPKNEAFSFLRVIDHAETVLQV